MTWHEPAGVNLNLCIGTTRVFATGFSFGGMITYSLSMNHQEDPRAAVGIAPASDAFRSLRPRRMREQSRAQGVTLRTSVARRRAGKSPITWPKRKGPGRRARGQEVARWPTRAGWGGPGLGLAGGH
jgi:poly(3-hydroxybutyrate) depolymerase